MRRWRDSSPSASVTCSAPGPGLGMQRKTTTYGVPRAGAFVFALPVGQKRRDDDGTGFLMWGGVSGRPRPRRHPTRAGGVRFPVSSPAGRAAGADVGRRWTGLWESFFHADAGTHGRTRWVFYFNPIARPGEDLCTRVLGLFFRRRPYLVFQPRLAGSSSRR
jgi:hypothetical protein